MPHRSTLARQQMKKDDPTKYEEFLRKRREAEQKKRDEEKKKWEEESHTRSQIDERQRHVEEKRARERERYWKKKAEKTRQTRSSSNATPGPSAKRPRDMSPEEYKRYRADQRKRERDNLSTQKKTAIKMKRREQRKKSRDEKEQLLASAATPEAGPSSDSNRLRQSLYNLNHEYKEKARQLGLTSTEYARSALNLINPRTPEKRAAILEQQKVHPCKSLFQEKETEAFNIQDELGLEERDTMEHGPAAEESISKALHNQVKLFYCQDDVSRMLPHSRYSTKHGPARIMWTTVKQAYERFLKGDSDRKIGLTLFQTLRPKNVRLMGSVSIDGCLCVYCTNVRLKKNVMNQLLLGSGQLPPETDMVNFLCCPHEQRWPKIECIDGKCPYCSDRMRPFHIFCRDIYNTQSVKWQHWEKNSEGKMEPKLKEGSLRELLTELEADLVEPTRGTSFVQHLFTAYWQYSQFKMCRLNPDEGEVVMVQDFGENRKAAYAAEIKSAHFGKHQITVHPVVCFYRSGDSVVRESHIFLSDDTTHDHHAVREFTNQSIDLLRQSVSIKKLTIWSDGAASQYKGRGSFHDLTLMPHQPQRCYYGSEHGKGEADGETGILSQALKRANYQGHNFRHAKDMVDYLAENYGTNTRKYILVKAIDRVDLADDMQTIPGTRKYHQFQALRDYVLQARRLACFCTACREGKPAQCLNKEYVGPYDVHKCKPSAKILLNQGFAETSRTDDVPSTSTGQTTENPCPNVGDFLKLTCHVNKATKTYYATVIEVNSDACPTSFSVRFLQKSGTKYAFHTDEDVGLISPGPPDFYSWVVLKNTQWTMDHREHYIFSV